MECTYKYQHRRKMPLLIIFCLVIGLLSFISIEETRPYKVALDQYEVPVYMANDFDMTNYFERKKYEAILQDYQLRVFRSIIIVGIGALALFYIMKPSKIRISSDGVQIYSLLRNKASIHKKWSAITALHIGYGEGIHGLLGSRGIKITDKNEHDSLNTIFISTKNYRDEDSLHQLLEKFCDQVADFSLEDKKITEAITISQIFKKGFALYKENYKNYYVYSVIFCLFFGLQQYFKTSVAGIIALWSSIYFGYRALAALYYKIRCDHEQTPCSFDKSWAYGQTQIGRTLGATLLRDVALFFCVVVIGFAVYINVNQFITLVTVIIFGFLGVFSYAYLFLMPYIAAIIDKQVSFTSINAQIFKVHKGAIFLLSALGIIKTIVFMVYILVYKSNIAWLMEILQIKLYSDIVLEFLLMPLYATCSMTLLSKIPLKNEIGGAVIEEMV